MSTLDPINFSDKLNNKGKYFMKIRILLAILALALITSTTACKKEEGTMEKMGKSMDKAAHDTKEAAEEAVHDAERAVEDAKDGG